MSLNEAKYDISRQQHSHIFFFYQFILHSQITLRSVPPFHQMHRRGTRPPLRRAGAPFTAEPILQLPAAQRINNTQALLTRICSCSY